MAYQDAHSVWSQSITSFARIWWRRMSFHRGRMRLSAYKYFCLVVVAISGLPAASRST